MSRIRPTVSSSVLLFASRAERDLQMRRKIRSDRNEVGAKRFRGCVERLVYLGFKLFRRAVSGGKHTIPTGLRDRGHEIVLADPGHRTAQDRVIHGKEITAVSPESVEQTCFHEAPCGDDGRLLTIQARAQIPFAGVGKNHDEQLAFVFLPGSYGECGMHCCAARHPREDTFRSRQSAHRRRRLLV